MITSFYSAERLGCPFMLTQKLPSGIHLKSPWCAIGHLSVQHLKGVGGKETVSAEKEPDFKYLKWILTKGARKSKARNLLTQANLAALYLRYEMASLVKGREKGKNWLLLCNILWGLKAMIGDHAERECHINLEQCYFAHDYYIHILWNQGEETLSCYLHLGAVLGYRKKVIFDHLYSAILKIQTSKIPQRLQQSKIASPHDSRLKAIFIPPKLHWVHPCQYMSSIDYCLR